MIVRIVLILVPPWTTDVYPRTTLYVERIRGQGQRSRAFRVVRRAWSSACGHDRPLVGHGLAGDAPTMTAWWQPLAGTSPPFDHRL